ALEGIRVLDRFAGAGGISLEFLSRGAAVVVSVERDPVLHAHLLRTGRELGTANWHAVKADAFTFLKAGQAPYDVVFADPPFDLPATAGLPELVRNSGLLAPDGLMIVEHPRGLDLALDPWFDVRRK